MSAEPPANSFRATVLSAGAVSQNPVVRTKQAHVDIPFSDLTKVSVSRSESRRGEGWRRSTLNEMARSLGG